MKDIKTLNNTDLLNEYDKVSEFLEYLNKEKEKTEVGEQK